MPPAASVYGNAPRPPAAHQRWQPPAYRSHPATIHPTHIQYNRPSPTYSRKTPARPPYPPGAPLEFQLLPYCSNSSLFLLHKIVCYADCDTTFIAGQARKPVHLAKIWRHLPKISRPRGRVKSNENVTENAQFTQMKM